MFINYLKIALRNLWKNKGYSFLNIFGLAIGICCAALIFLWVEDEVNYNSNFADSNLIYTIPSNQKYDGQWRTFTQATPGPLAAELKESVPGIEHSAKTWQSDFLLNANDKSVNKSGWYVDPEYLDIFKLEFVEGNANNALTDVKSIVITQTLANQIFGKNVPALGQSIRLNDAEEFKVTGVVEDLPNNVTFGFECLVPFRNFELENPWTKEYGANFATTFVKLSPTANFETVNQGVRDFVMDKFEEDDTVFFLHAMKDWRLRDNFENGEQAGGRIQYVKLFIIIALFILLIASINFMNLATARSEKRANEVGVRKALGSDKRSLIYQFITESVMTTLIAGLLGVALIAILLPQFNMLIEKQLIMGWDDPLHLLGLFTITLSLGILAGLYPAFYLSSFNPVEVMKGMKTTSRSANLIRKGLVIGQFVISIVFIISAFTVYEQIQYVKSRELGYNKENLLRIPVKGDIVKNFSPIKQDLLATHTVNHMALSNSKILNAGNNGSGLTWKGGIDTEDILISYRYVSNGFFETVGITLKEGRNFSSTIAKDSSSAIISESFAKLMGDDSAIGKTINRWGDSYTVTGVAEDYLYGDMYGTSDPVMFINNHSEARYLYMRVDSTADLNAAINQIEETLAKYNPAFPPEYEFVDSSFNAKFQSENLVGKLSQVFALLAVIISCLGLFGLSAYTAEQRKKEIGVRKVLGSSVVNIVKLLSADFLKLVMIAMIIAIPAGYFLMNNWLQDFAYRIDINYWTFFIAAAMAQVIALATVSFQAIKAAIANPVTSLRTE
ncbi:ABC transporter permease [Gelidibacter maritimus]|uniref:ABC transporter permease n=1 Tax=Gelidibacter maritimus TaxID=2761487 RepID=A0A7W2M2Q6_9FLAO|nr:ABC transporter permease [Gelidibacter maritimus]MBA6151561.1 ABC transporter permease [Gelidibacter maritimus]